MLAVALSGCSVTLTKSVVSTTHANEANYRQTGSRDWAAVIQASTPWNPVGSSPGACDEGTSASGCVATDQAVIPAMSALISDLRTVSVPNQFVAANDAVIQAARSEIQGLKDRYRAIEQQDNTLFKSAMAELASAAHLFQIAYARFPSPAPTPALFGNGRHGS